MAQFNKFYQSHESDYRYLFGFFFLGIFFFVGYYLNFHKFFLFLIGPAIYLAYGIKAALFSGDSGGFFSSSFFHFFVLLLPATIIISVLMGFLLHELAQERKKMALLIRYSYYVFVIYLHFFCYSNLSKYLSPFLTDTRIY